MRPNVQSWDKKPYSIYRITDYKSNKIYSIYELIGDPGAIAQDVIKLLFEYHSVVGVTGVQLNKNGISWEFQDHLYSTAEVDRMINLKAFT